MRGNCLGCEIICGPGHWAVITEAATRFTVTVEARMKTRCLTHETDLPVPPEKVFALLHTPSAIRACWGTSQAIVVPKEGGFWIASWGPMDNPDYITAFKIK